jgi:Xaa-Pro aminopeptidase
MAFSIEPGIYTPGIGRVLIEYNRFIAESEAETLSDFPRELERLE